MGLGAELDGITIISIEQAVAAPYCSLLLADAGARVIKVERPDGDFARGYDRGANGKSCIFAWLNRGKESICVDLNQAKDQALLHRLLAQADVFVHNLAPGNLRQRGFGGARLRQTNHKLITCDISGYGATGGSKKAYDFLVQAESGLCAVTGSAEQPARVGISICDIATGLTAFSGILRALIKRGATNTSSGAGMDLSIAMFDVIADWMNMPLVSHRYLGGAPARLGLSHALIAPYGAFAAKDGGQVLIAIQSNREWQTFCARVLGQPALGTDQLFKDNPARVANRAALHAVINRCFGQHARAELIAMLEAARIANARLSEVSDLSDHPFLRNLAIKFGDVELAIADLPIQNASARAVAVPALNQHGDAIRAEFGGG